MFNLKAIPSLLVIVSGKIFNNAARLQQGTTFGSNSSKSIYSSLV